MMSSSGKLRQSPKKGPGKVKEYVKTSSKPRISEITGDMPSKELSYPYIKVSDNEHLFPRYFTVLNRSEEDGIGMEDMDALQLEMEVMLSTIVKRNYILNDEIQVMNTAEEKRDKKNKANMSKGGPPSPGKRSKHHEKPVKKLKDVSKPKDTNTHSPLSIKINKNKVTPGQVWTDLKYKARKHAALLRADHLKTSNKPKNEPALNDIEKKILTIIGPETAEGYCVADSLPERQEDLLKALDGIPVPSVEYDPPQLFLKELLEGPVEVVEQECENPDYEEAGIFVESLAPPVEFASIQPDVPSSKRKGCEKEYTPQRAPKQQRLRRDIEKSREQFAELQAGQTEVLRNVASSPAQTAPMSDPHELPDQTKMGSRRVLVPKNDTPNKFWLSVEPYCADILPEDIKLLDMMIQEHDQDTDYQKIPPLGRHYSLRWAQEDMLEEQDAASSQGKMGKGKPVELPHLSRRVDRPSETVGPLTQRLITSFMEENVMVPVIEPPAFDRTKVRGGENATPPRLNTFRNFTTNNSMSIERRIRKELEDQGLLDPVDPSKEDPVDDEILAEIKRCQTELKTISAQNFQQLKRLKKLATEEVMRQDLKKKLQHVDNEILEVFWRIHNTKLKKLPIMKREQELAVDALKEREDLLKQIECVGDNT